MLSMMFLQDMHNKNKIWRQFEKDLIYKNRFFSDNPIVKELEDRADESGYQYKKGFSFYRARLFKKNSTDQFLRCCLEMNGFLKDKIEDVLSNWTAEQKFSLISSIMGEDESKAELSETQKKWLKNIRFKGYNAAESAAPPDEDLIGNGRANPDHIRYLYLSEDNITPVYEVRPIIKDQISVGKFKLQKDIKVFDMAKDIRDCVKDNGSFEWPSLYTIIGQMFSKPSNGEANQYIATQFLAEKIKLMGLDGIRFRSSLHIGGINVVLFDPTICRAVSSDLVDVESISLTLSEPAVYRMVKKERSTNR